MDLNTVIGKRRSIRQYKPESPPEKWLEDMLDCARQAPSPSNRQPVQIARINSNNRCKDLQEALANGRNTLLDNCPNKKLRNRINFYFRYSEFMFSAPWLFLLGTRDNIPGFEESLRLTHHKNLQKTADDISLGIFLGNLLNKATELGLGTCVLTAPFSFVSHPAELLGLNDIQPKCFLTAGFSAEKPEMPTRKPIEEILEQC